jgi:redox-sensitive bicupin YhaK (pirin superfamily)
MQRAIEKIINAQVSNDGDGVKILRSIGSRQLIDINPFLLLDELRSDDAVDYIGGFPSHPHRGFETVTYMLAGQMRHKDSAGNEGVIRAGDLQWMTAGSGIIHSEMPEQTQGRLWGFQFWINLSAKEKMRAPRYQEITADNIPELLLTNGKVRILAGEVKAGDGVAKKGVAQNGVTKMTIAKSTVTNESDDHSNNVLSGAIQDIVTHPLLLDVQVDTGSWQTAFSETHVALVYVYSGELTIKGRLLQEQQLAVLSAGDSIELMASSQPFGALILAAKPIDEPIARSGPFVMNTQEELQQAYSDYRSGGFVK